MKYLPVCLLFSLIFFKIINHPRKQKPLLFLLFTPLSMSAQNGEIGGGSNGEIIFWFFVLGFLVSIMPERKKPFEKKAMTVIKLTILGVLVPLVGFAQTDKDIREGRKLPDFQNAKIWNHPDTVHGFKTANVYLPLLNACDFGKYEVDFYTYQNDVLYFYYTFKMMCFCDMPALFDTLTPEMRRRDSESLKSMGNGRWYAIIRGVDCGYIYTYEVKDTAKAWQMQKTECN